MSELFETLPAIAPLRFFSLAFEVKKLPRLTTLPDTSDYLSEVHFADVKMGWSGERIALQVDIRKPFEETSYPDFRKGDSIELFFDTRDLKTAGFFTRFCHHFVILPQEVQGVRAQEVSKFRADDAHLLCDPDAIVVETEFTKRSYSVTIGIAAEALYGFDPKQFDRLGFTYRLNRPQGTPQHLALPAPVEGHPSLWASVKLVEK